MAEIRKDTPLKIRNVKLLADRLCYLENGMDGLHVRYGMSRADKNYYDKYDSQAREIIDEWERQEQR